MLLPARSTLADAQPVTTGRSIHLVDVENLIGSSLFTDADVRNLERLYRSTACVAERDLVVVACGRRAAATTWFAWSEARRLSRGGPNGADEELLTVIRTERLAERFVRVVIASGDHVFAEPCARLQAAGCSVTVVSRRDALSRQLRFAVRDIRFIDFDPACESASPLPVALRLAQAAA